MGHDHRFFFTSENVYKRAKGMINYYSGLDRGNEVLTDGINLRLPSGSLLDSGNRRSFMMRPSIKPDNSFSTSSLATDSLAMCRS